MKNSKLPIVAIVGRPNVGKSTLLNRLLGQKRAITHDSAGTTRDPVQGIAEWRGRYFQLADTAGIEKPDDNLDSQVQEQIDEAAAVASAIIVVVDAGNIITTEDRRAAKLALATKKPVILALNKIDTAQKGLADRYERLGIKTMVQISGLNGNGTGDLLDYLVEFIPAAPEPTSSLLTVALLGRPNVGKSSLLNALAGSPEAIVSDVAGTTRDIGTVEINHQDNLIKVLDTAGLRRRGKIMPGIEKFSTLKTIGAINDSDICLVVIDAEELAVAGDQHIAGMVDDAGKGLVLVVNKWDKPAKDTKTQDKFIRRVQRDFQFAWWAPLVFTSATTGRGVDKLLELTLEINQRRQTKISTPELNRLLSKLTSKQPPAGKGRYQPKINYVTQTGTAPPKFTFFTTHPSALHFSYKRYLENGLRAAYDFTGTPIKLEFRDKRKEQA